jgi:hypothetical protein
VTRVTADAALDADFIGSIVEDAAGTLWIGGNGGLWSLRDRLVKVKGLRPHFPTAAFAYVRTTGAVYAQLGSATYQIDSDSAVLVHATSRVGSLGLWAESGAIWTVVGQDVLRDGQRVFTLAESLGGVESLMSHPATMTHGSVPEAEKMKLGVTPGLVRISVGIEDVEDLEADLDQALR